METTVPTYMISIISKDNKLFSINIESIKISNTIKNMLEDLGEQSDEAIPIFTINGSILEKVLIFCDYVYNNPRELDFFQMWANDKSFAIPIPEWFKDFISVEEQMLFDIIIAANFLDIQLLINLGCKVIADSIRHKTPAELKQKFTENLI